MNIVLHIERLVVDGVPLGAGAARRLQSGITGELTRLLADGVGSALIAGGSVPRLDGGTIAASGSDPAPLATAIAQAIYSGLSGRESR